MQRFTVLAIIATMLITAPSGIRAEKEKIRKIALVTFRVGDAEIQRGDKVRKIRVREIIEENDVIRTGKNSRVICRNFFWNENQYSAASCFCRNLL